MFNYIEGVLKRFSARQRILVLILILCTIITVNAVPKIITAMTYDNVELTKKVQTQAFINESLNKDVTNLNNEVAELNKKIRDNQMDCTNMLLNREKEILEQLSRLQIKVMNSIPVKMMDEKSSYSSINDKPIVDALKGMEEIKLGIEKSINSKK